VAVSSSTGTVVTARIKLVSWDLATGAQRWSVPGPDYRCAPLFSADNATLYVIRAADSNSDTVMAVDAHDGTIRWTHPMADTTDHPLAVSGNTLYISPYLSHGLLALDTRTGAARWTLTDTTSDRQWRVSAVPAAGLALALTDTTLHAFPAD
jgi:outer membrane protein assembly factor BamB